MKSDRPMKRCKACNYLAYDDEIHGVCPACGLPDKVFEPYERRANGVRHAILDVHFHSISLHIPQAIGPIIILLYGATFLIDSLRGDLYYLLRILAVAYPVAVFPAILSGIVDGRLRFKKALTPLLKKKLLLASMVLVITSGMSIAALLTTDFTANIHAIIIPAFFSLSLQGSLARMGIRMVECIMPGK